MSTAPRAADVPSLQAAEAVLVRLLVLCESAAGGTPLQEVRDEVTRAAAVSAPLASGLVGTLDGGELVVLASSGEQGAERVALEGVPPIPGGVPALLRAPDGAMLVLQVTEAEDGRPVVIGGPLAVAEPTANDLRVVALVARAGGLALRLAGQRMRGDRARATAERLVEAGINLASRSSLQEVLGRLVDVAREILGARYAALGVLNADRTGLEKFITSGLRSDEIAAIGPEPRGHGLLGLLIRDPRPVRLDRISTDPRSCGFPPNHPPMESFLGVPIALRGEVFGNLYLTEKVSGSFTEEDERIALTLAAQAAVAIANARRYEAERRQGEELRSVQEVARAILSTLDLAELLPLIVRRARRLTGAETMAVAVADGDDGDQLRVRYAHGVDALALEDLRTPADPEAAAAHLASALGASDVDVEPLEVDGVVVGGLAAVSRFPLEEGGRRVLSLLAAQAAIAIANAETFAAERTRLRESAKVQAAEARAAAAAEGLRQAIEAQEAERARVARELHDEAGQSLTALALNLRLLEDHVDEDGRARLSDLRQMINGVSSSLRSLATDLRPSGLREHGLASAIERQAAKLREATGMVVDVAVDRLPDELPAEIQIALFRVVQEALTNVARHSGAGQASVVVSHHGGRVRVVVEDDGRGFDPATPTGRLGLRGIRERVELLGGALRIESAPGAGAAVIVDVEVGR